ncbi:TetR family transcriptional regulator [Actinomadura sp. HBU206391]|uniref:TetR/AcrR family transcriptional regulator n=1 Tax=Actinomadura sp. HBU206391 TaxID=2731692 RepID=UPI00164F547B|nr:TetR family transcriptional regulator [Actinomadura sp. HBU206391]MBC6459846.1 TetR/AcrR family transcriptional regulator [Actinomadura sp. HBU206391]
MVAQSGRKPGRRPGPNETREAILTAARELFAEKGYDGASIRAIARAADVNPALVHHFFGTKENVFIEAMRLPFNPAELLPLIIETSDERIGETLIRVFLGIWGDPDRRAPLIAMLRSAMTNEQAATMMRQFVSKALIGRAAELRGIPLLKVDAAVGQMIGVMLLRYVIQVEPIASASEEELVELLAPTLQRYLCSSS